MPVGVELQAVDFVRSVKMFDREMFAIIAERDKIELHLLANVLLATKTVEGQAYQRMIPLNHVETMVPMDAQAVNKADQETRSEPKPTRSKRR